LENDLNPNVLSQWKQQFLRKSPSIFENNIKHRPSNRPVNMDEYMVNIRRLREDSNMSQEHVAQYLGTSQTMYARYENGASKMPIRHLIMLSRLYGVSTDYILGIGDEP
jgi:DNA-binding transcriptional regulator YiaG